MAPGREFICALRGWFSVRLACSVRLRLRVGRVGTPWQLLWLGDHGGGIPFVDSVPEPYSGCASRLAVRCDQPGVYCLVVSRTRLALVALLAVILVSVAAASVVTVQRFVGEIQLLHLAVSRTQSDTRRTAVLILIGLPAVVGLVAGAPAQLALRGMLTESEVSCLPLEAWPSAVADARARRGGGGPPLATRPRRAAVLTDRSRPSARHSVTIALPEQQLTSASRHRSCPRRCPRCALRSCPRRP